MLQLRSGTNIHVCRQSTSAIKEDILLAAEGLRVNQADLRSLLNVAKTISFDPVHRHSVIFFDRATAREYEFATVPCKGMVYRVSNMHQLHQGSVWARQLGNDGTWMAIHRNILWSYTTSPDSRI